MLKLVEKRQKATLKLLSVKGKEYAGEDDALVNFKCAAGIDEETPERALWGMWKKHLVALKDFIQSLEEGEEVPFEQWEEKIGDSINYLCLLEALIVERYGV